MPEYLSPGVYVEETSFRSKSIEGVSTSTAGFVGPARWGPISGEPELITSLADFERIYGGFDDLMFDGVATTNYLWHGVRAFFEEGGQRLYVSRVFDFGVGVFQANVDPNTRIPTDTSFYAKAAFDQPDQGTYVARFPGSAGNMRVTLTARAGSNAFVSANVQDPSSNVPKKIRQVSLTQVQSYDLVHISTPRANDKTNWDPFSLSGAGASGVAASGSFSSASSMPIGVADGLFVAHWNTDDPKDHYWELLDDSGGNIRLDDARFKDGTRIRPVTMLVEAEYPTTNAQGIPGFGTSMLLGEFGFNPRDAASLVNTFTRQPATRQEALTTPFSIELLGDMGNLLHPPKDKKLTDNEMEQQLNQLTIIMAREVLGSTAIDSLNHLRNAPGAASKPYVFVGGEDGSLPDAAHYQGDEFLFSDFVNDPVQSPKNGLLAFESVEDISIVAAPGYSTNGNSDEVFAIHRAVIDHCEKMRYRVAVLDTPPNNLVSGALNFRNLTSTKYGALYYPWVTILDPATDQRLNLPPSGFVAGIYARNDTEHAVFKAPANEVVHLAIDFEQRINKAQQDVLNPQGVNCFRYFPGHGFLLWGARTISDDPEWKYISVRRYFAYLEHSIDRGTQWVVFENNGPQLWDNVRRTIEDFLLNEWKMGALLGDKPEQAYFVRCDRSTMTQNDLDNGRLICLIGVAVVKPAEFVIFRIGQWTASTNK
jgi:uncharacterized protein